MKRSIFLLFLAVSYLSFAQEIDFGIKAGASYPLQGEVLEISTLVLDDEIKDPETIIGGHAGFFARLGFNQFYLQPEAYFSFFKTDYESSFLNQYSMMSYRVDVPLLAGFKFLKVGRIFAGPVFSYHFQDDFTVNSIEHISSDEFTFGGQVGIGVALGKFHVDLRYEAAFGEREAEYISENIQIIPDQRNSILMLSFGFSFL